MFEDLIRDVYSQRISEAQQPRSFRLQKSSGESLYCLGVRHFRSSENSQYTHLIQEWDAFLGVQGEKIAIAEKSKNDVSADSAQDAVLLGEDALLHWLAGEADIESMSPELGHASVLQYLIEKGFKPEDIVYAYILSTMEWRQRVVPSKSALEMLESGLRYWNSYSEILGFSPTRDWFAAKHHENVTDPDLEHDTAYRQLATPFGGSTEYSRILAAKGQFRNIALLRMIRSFTEEGLNIFVVFGANHIYAIEPALRALYGEKKGS